MDVKDELDKLFSEREQRHAEAAEKERNQQDRQTQIRNEAIRIINVIVEPAIKALVADLKRRDIDASYSVNHRTIQPSISFEMKLERSSAVTSCPASKITLDLFESVRVAQQIWTNKGDFKQDRTELSNCDRLTREWVDERMLKFVGEVLKAV